MADFEKLGIFYLGRPYDLALKQPKEGYTLYDSKDLVTHAVCLGMTGSGKTGLCTCLLEEAAIDGIPSIIIDPKGDMTNLMLTFPGLSAQEFRPWINEDDARTKGLSPDDFAQQQADTWRKGLADWGEDGSRIKRLRDAADVRIYTPGSSAGLPVSILKSFAAPPPAIVDDRELLAERINTTATGLLTLLGIDADPVRSREHILISNLLSQSWIAGRDLDLAALIGQIQQPPMQRIGVLDIESFYPSKDRFTLAMQLNNLLAAPGFDMWLQGEALDVSHFLYAGNGKPRVSIFYIAHLSDTERMFFVSLLLGQVIGWMRSQPGTTSLRSILYMDEIFGYFPPTANPPSKQPFLTLLKQARAFGLGVVLATQNPVDLDYKGLSNAGTWFLGRLQTERDKARVLDGLEGVTASSGGSFNRSQMDKMLSGLGKRVFLLHNVNKSAPDVFTTRWALSYLTGPLTREQIRTVMAPFKTGTAGQPPAVAAAPAAVAASRHAAVPAGVAPAARPVLPPTISQYFLPPAGRAQNGVAYLPVIYAAANMYFSNAKAGVDVARDVAFVVSLSDGPVPVDWDGAAATDVAPNELRKDPLPSAAFSDLPAAAARPQSYAQWRADFTKWLYRSQSLELLHSKRSGMVSKPGESERDFRIRLQVAARETQDEQKDKIKQKYEAKLQTYDEKIRRAEQAVQREKSQEHDAKLQTAFSLGSTFIGALMGGKKITSGTVGRATSTARGVSRTMRQAGDVGRAQEDVKALQEQRDDLAAQMQAELDDIASTKDAQTEPLETISVKPKPTGLTIQLLTLVWSPA